MELRQIRYYIEVVDQGSFTQAAEACFISQSAISQQVRALEEELGLPLLLRQGRSFALTPAGDYFYRKAKAWQGGLEDIVRETQRRADWGERVLRVGFACNYAGRELYQAIAAFAQQCPQTVVQVVTGTHEELYDLLRFDGVDVKINEQRRAFSQAYENLPLAYRPTVAEVCAHGGLRGRASLSLEEARALTAAFLERESWVIDGNYAGLLQERRMEEADRIVFLDVCRGRCLLQALGRYWRHRGTVRDSAAPGCVEKLDGEFVRWLLWEGRSRERREAYEALARRYGDKTTVCRTSGDCRRLLQCLSPR